MWTVKLLKMNRGYGPVSVTRTWSGFARTRLGRLLSHTAVRTLERVGVAPSGATELSALLNRTADALVDGGRLGIFTPLYFFAARKPK